MFRKLVDVLKEVFWIKPSRKSRAPAPRKSAKKTIKHKSKPKAKPKLKSKIPALKKPSKSIPEAKVLRPKKAVKSAVNLIDPSLVEVGVITHYFDRIKVCVVKLTKGTVLIGDKLTIQGVKNRFVQKVWSMQVESEDVKVAKKGQIIGIKVDKIVAVNDKVFK